jgi:hypothetical protein
MTGDLNRLALLDCFQQLRKIRFRVGGGDLPSYTVSQLYKVLS